jgi:hypothetical protein
MYNRRFEERSPAPDRGDSGTEVTTSAKTPPRMGRHTRPTSDDLTTPLRQQHESESAPDRGRTPIRADSASTLGVLTGLSTDELGVLRWVADLLEPTSLDLRISRQAEPSFKVFAHLSDRELDATLQLLAGAGLIHGERGEGDGSLSWWTGVEITAPGLLELGEWAPDNPNSLWRRRDAPVLAWLADRESQEPISTHPRSDANSTLVKGISDADLHRSLVILSGFGYIDAERWEPDLFGGIQVTLRGRNALRANVPPKRERPTEQLAASRRSVEAVGQRAWSLGMGDALEPLEQHDRTVLTRFVDLASRLSESSLVRGEVRLTMQSPDGSRSEYLVEYAGDEAVQAALLPFRALYRDEEPASFRHILGILRSRAIHRGTEASKKLVELLDELGRGYRGILKSAGPIPLPPGGLGGKGDAPPLKTRQVIEDWLYGEHFHWDADKAQRLAEFEPPEMLLFSFVSAIHHASFVYDALADIARQAVETR